MLDNPGWLWLTVPIAVLLAIAAGAGVFVGGLYSRDPAVTVPALVGQDLLSLVLALPALIIAGYFAGRGSRLALIIWLGMLSYLVYSYALFVFGVQFNSLFLVYVALLGCSLYALIGTLSTANLVDIRTHFGPGTPARAVSIFLIIMAALYYFLWLSETIPALVTKTVPQSVQNFETPTNAVHVMDMAVALPALVLAAIWLWQGRPIGYLLGAVLLVKMLTLGLALLAMTLYTVRAALPTQPEQTATYIVMTLVSLGMLVWYLGNLQAGAISTSMQH
jgi:hypothetical protein